MASQALELLALRKQVLIARAGLQRLQFAAHAESAREGLRWPRLAASLAASPPARSALAGLLVLAGRRWRILRLAAGVLTAAKIASSLWAHTRRETDRREPPPP